MQRNSPASDNGAEERGIDEHRGPTGDGVREQNGDWPAFHPRIKTPHLGGWGKVHSGFNERTQTQSRYIALYRTGSMDGKVFAASACGYNPAITATLNYLRLTVMGIGLVAWALLCISLALAGWVRDELAGGHT
jgi:hypothetical protein